MALSIPEHRSDSESVRPPERRDMIAVTSRWSELAEQRLAHFIELYNSGRWRHYYDEREFLQRMRDVKAAADAWGRLAGGKPSNRAAA